jgi:uncharacterized protein YjiS (DUF1127 family)
MAQKDRTMTYHLLQLRDDYIRSVAVHRRQEWLGNLIGNGLGALWLWAVRWRSRRSLDQLDHRLLDDVGLSREQARREANKWFWAA